MVRAANPRVRDTRFDPPETLSMEDRLNYVN